MRTRILFAAVLALVAALHALGLSFRLPWTPGNDEHVYVWHQRLFELPVAERAADPSYRYYPHLVSRLAALLPRAARGPGPESLERELEIASADYLCARAVVAMLALLALPAAWSLGRRFGGPRLALGASALTGSSVLFAWYACEARPHAAFAGLACLAVALAARAQERGGAASFLVAGVGAGLALATLQPGVFLLAPLAVAHFARPRAARAGELRWLLASIALAAAVAWPFYPFSFAPAAPAEALPGAFVFASHQIWIGSIDGSGFAVLARALWDHEPVLLVVVLGGVTLWLLSGAPGLARFRRRGLAGEMQARSPLLVVLAFVIPYAVAFGLYRHTFPRFALPLVPFVALFAAWTALEVARGITRPKLLAAGAPWLVLALAFAPVLRLGYLRAVPDTTQEAALWLASHARRDHDEIRVLSSITLPLIAVAGPPPAPRRGIGLRASPWILHQASIPEDLRRAEGWRIRDLPLLREDPEGLITKDPGEYVRRLGADYLVIEVWDRPPVRQLLGWLRENAELVARLAPGDAPEQERTFLMQYDPGVYGTEVNWVARSFHVQRFGTVIEIYRTGAEPGN